MGARHRGSGLGAGRALFFTWMIITVSAPYFAGKLYLCFSYFSVITDMT